MTAKSAEIAKRGVQPSSARFASSAVDFSGLEDGALRSCLASRTLRRPASLDRYVRAFHGDIDSTLGQWYEVLVVADGSQSLGVPSEWTTWRRGGTCYTSAVWRAERGQTMTNVLKTASRTITSGPKVYFDASQGALAASAMLTGHETKGLY